MNNKPKSVYYDQTEVVDAIGQVQIQIIVFILFYVIGVATSILVKIVGRCSIYFSL